MFCARRLSLRRYNEKLGGRANEVVRSFEVGSSEWRQSINPLDTSKLSWTQVRWKSTPKAKPNTLEYWIDRTNTLKKFPLTKALKEIYPGLGEARKSGGAKTARATNPHVRTQIVSPALCDDVIKYIGAQLEPYRGCDVLDINPGVGLWSQKLHSFLKPRSHVLLESDYKKYEQFLDPLLKAKNSKYSLVCKDATDFNTYQEIVSSGIFPHQTRPDIESAERQSLNNTLLVTGSLGWDPKLPGMKFDSMAKQVYLQFANSTAHNDLIHNFGPVRSLLWFQYDDFRPLIAESIALYQKSNRITEMTQNITVVVQGERQARRIGKGSIGREPQFEIESVINAMRAGKEKGIELPAHRRENIHDFAEDLEKINGGSAVTRSATIHTYLRQQEVSGKSTTGSLQESFRELYTEEKSLRDEILYDNSTKAADTTITQTSQDLYNARKYIKDKETKVRINKFQGDYRSYNRITNVKAKMEGIGDLSEEAYQLECKILEMQEGSSKDEALRNLEALDARWEDELSNLTWNYISAAVAEMDDRLAIRSPPYPRLQWDRRPFEPLTMSPAEAWPQNRLSLVLTEPIPRQPDQDARWYEYMQDFVFGLYTLPSQDIEAALDKMQHGLSDIIKDCPKLRSPKDGGRLQMKHLRVRLLTSEQVEELGMAYRAWPFKAPESDHPRYFRNKFSLHDGSSESGMTD